MNEAVSLQGAHETARLAALRRYRILDTEPEEEFDEIVDLIRSIFNIPYAAINLIDFDRQWSKAAASLDPESSSSEYNVPRDQAFCDHTIRSNEAMMVEDATRDSRFSGNDFVAGPTGIRSYLGVPLTTPDGFNIGALCVFGTEPRTFTVADIEVLKNFSKVVMSQFELRLTARLDSLTGVLTRRAFMTRLDHVVAENASHPTSLVLLDLDHFKSINDRFGHPAGDAVLTRVAAAMTNPVRKSDSIGRLGGEEFGILLKGADLTQAYDAAERMREHLASLSIPELGEAKVTVSAGVAQRCAGEGRASWFDRTDRALYSAKRGGRDRVVFAAPVEGS